MILQIGLCYLDPADLPGDYGFPPGSLPPLGASPDGVLTHTVLGQQHEAVTIQQRQPYDDVIPAVLQAEADPLPVVAQQQAESTGRTAVAEGGSAAEIEQLLQKLELTSSRFTHTPSVAESAPTGHLASSPGQQSASFLAEGGATQTVASSQVNGTGAQCAGVYVLQPDGQLVLSQNAALLLQTAAQGQDDTKASLAGASANSGSPFVPTSAPTHEASFISEQGIQTGCRICALGHDVDSDMNYWIILIA